MPKRYFNKKGTRSHLRTTSGRKVFSAPTTGTTRRKRSKARKRAGKRR